MKRYLIILMLTSGVALAGEPDAGSAAGKMIYDSFCTSACHQQRDTGRLSAAQWRKLIKDMQARMHKAGMPSLTKQEQQQLLTYLIQRQ